MSSRLVLSSFESLALTFLAKPANKLYMLVNLVDGHCSHLLCDKQGALQLFTASELECLSPTAVVSEHYLGALDEQFIWAAVVSLNSEESYHGGQWLGLRAQLTILDEHWFSLTSRALQLSQWFHDHKFCGRCGTNTQLCAEDGAKFCPICNLRFYPRISPCMIVLVTRGDELLLAHHQRASRVVYSALAGFVEAGESVEQTVIREIMEEVGLEVSDVEYFRSQPWAFPHQLMLGFFARYVAGDIRIDKKEIVDAQWFRFDELPEIPLEKSIAGQLINHYVRQRLALYSAD